MSNYIGSCMVDAECGTFAFCEHRQCRNKTLGSPCDYHKDQYVDLSYYAGSFYDSGSYYNKTSCPYPYVCDKRLSRCVSQFSKSTNSETCTSDDDCSSFQYCDNQTLTYAHTCKLRKLVSEACTDSNECLRNHACYEGKCIAPCTTDAQCYESNHKCVDLTIAAFVSNSSTDGLRSLISRTSGYCVSGTPTGRTGFYVGVILGPIVFVALMILLGLWMRKRRLRRHNAAIAAAKTSQQAPGSPSIVATASTALATGDGNATAPIRYDGSELSMRAPSSAAAASGSHVDYPVVPPSYEFSTPKKNEEFPPSK